VKAFVRQVRRSGQRYAGQDADPDVVYERMPHVHFAIDGMWQARNHGAGYRFHEVVVRTACLIWVPNEPGPVSQRVFRASVINCNFLRCV
jgi:hypothetical protein